MLNSLGGEWRTDLQIERTSRLWTEFYQPIDDWGSFFVAPHAGLERRSATLYQGDHRLARYEATSMQGGVDIGAQLFRYGELRLGLLGGSLQPKLDTGPVTLKPVESSVGLGAYRLHLVLDQLDSVHFPRAGWRGNANVYASRSHLGADNSYTRWDVERNFVYSHGDRTLNLALKAGGKDGSGNLPFYDMFQWGGFLQQSGYATGQLLGENLHFARFMYYQRVLRGTLLEGAYGGISLEVGQVGNPRCPSTPRMACCARPACSSPPTARSAPPISVMAAPPTATAISTSTLAGRSEPAGRFSRGWPLPSPRRAPAAAHRSWLALSRS